MSPIWFGVVVAVDYSWKFTDPLYFSVCKLVPLYVAVFLHSSESIRDCLRIFAQCENMYCVEMAVHKGAGGGLVCDV